MMGFLKRNSPNIKISINKRNFRCN